MVSPLPPAPLGDAAGSQRWQDWFNKLQKITGVAGIAWSGVDKTGSALSDIVTRLHNSLQGIQGGALGDYQHLTTAQVAALAAAAPLASPTFTGTVSGISKTMVGLSNVDNTSDINKPVSTAQQTVLNLKADLASPALTGTPTVPTAAVGTSTTQAASTAYVMAQAFSGTYTPTLTNVTNLAASTTRLATYMRVGNTVTVAGQVDVDPTATGAVELGVSLPIASVFTTVYQLGGNAAAMAVAGLSAGIQADVTNARASVQWVAVDILNRTLTYTFTYTVI